MPVDPEPVHPDGKIDRIVGVVSGVVAFGLLAWFLVPQLYLTVSSLK